MVIDLTDDDVPPEPKPEPKPEPPMLQCGVCWRPVGMSSKDPNLVVLVDCGHTMCSTCYDGGGFMKRVGGKARECPYCNRKRDATKACDAPLGVRAYLNVQ